MSVNTPVHSSAPARKIPTFPAFFNSVFGPGGLLYPAHMIPPAISLADSRIQKLMVIIGPGSTKSTILSIAYPLYRIGQDPTECVLAVSGSEDLPRQWVTSAMRVVSHNKWYQRIFPEIAPDKELGWSTERGMFVQGHPDGVSDATYYACGIKSKTLVGLHGTLIILDDIQNEENSSSPDACQKVISFYYSTLSGRQGPRGAKWLVIGRRWSEWDIYGHLMQNGDWVAMRLPAEREGTAGLYWDVYVPPGLKCCWTEGAGAEVDSQNPKYRQFRAFYGVDQLGQGFYWPNEPEKRKEYYQVKRNQPAVAAATYQGDPGGLESGVFVDSDFERTLSLGPHAAMTPNLVPALLRKPGSMFLQAWDTASEVNPETDWSVCLTALLIPCSEWHHGEDPAVVGEPDPHYDVLILDEYRAKMEFGALAERMRTQFVAWAPQHVAVEKKSSGIQIIQVLRDILPLAEVKANQSKRARATMVVEGGTASVQGWMRQGRVLFWAEAPWLPDFIKECKNFSGDGRGFDDRVDALVHLVAQAIILGSNQAVMPSQEVIGAGANQPGGPQNQVVAAREGIILGIASLEGVIDLPGPLESRDLGLPLVTVCSNCSHWDSMTRMCDVWKQRKVAFDYCESWARKLGGPL